MHTIMYGQMYPCGYTSYTISWYIFFLLVYTYLCLLAKSGVHWASSPICFRGGSFYFVCSIFRGKFGIIFLVCFRNVPIVHVLVFQDRFWVTLDRAILEYFVSRTYVSIVTHNGKEKTVIPSEKISCLDHTTTTASATTCGPGCARWSCVQLHCREPQCPRTAIIYS